MNKYHRLRDTRKEGGIRMSVSIAAESAAEADAIFEERWAARKPKPDSPPRPGCAGALRPGESALAEQGTRNPTALPIITNQSLREQFMSPGALEIKRRTPTFT